MPPTFGRPPASSPSSTRPSTSSSPLPPPYPPSPLPFPPPPPHPSSPCLQIASEPSTSAEVKEDVTEEVKSEAAEDEEPLDIRIRNVVVCFTVRCHVNLRELALVSNHVYYERSKGVPSCPWFAMNGSHRGLASGTREAVEKPQGPRQDLQLRQGFRHRLREVRPTPGPFLRAMVPISLSAKRTPCGAPRRWPC